MSQDAAEVPGRRHERRTERGAVEDTKARQRYPWNGKVDIDCEITGDATKKYRVGFSVEDEVGGTNLTINTVIYDGGPDGGSVVTNREFVLSQGKYRFVWDAAADLPRGTRFGEVSVSIDLEPSTLADWKRVVTISTDGYAGSDALTDVPVLVRLSSAIEGFDYADFAAPDTGADMIFTDMEGTARYPYEIDEWHKDGESLVWVKLPELKKGTKFKLAYGRKGAGSGSSMYGREPDATAAKHEVWSDYAGVWHMNEDSGTAFDSTEHGLDALPDCGVNGDVGQMVAYENGACGRARVNETRKIQAGNYLKVPSYDALKLGDCFSFSCWLMGEGYTLSTAVARICTRKRNNTDDGGWGVVMSEDSIEMAGHIGVGVVFECKGSSTKWIHLIFAYSGTEGRCHINGELVCSGEITSATDNGVELAVGGTPIGTKSMWSGQYDEIRLRGGTLSADRIKADYDMIANRDFCTYGKVEGK